MKLKFLVPLLVSIASFAAAENEIGFVEKFALATDREAALSQLVPGTEDFYFYHALQLQNTGRRDALKEWMEQWGRRFPQSERRRILENRAAVIDYDRNPQETLQFLRDRLHVELNHEQTARDRKPDLPSSLAQSRIAPEVFQT